MQDSPLGVRLGECPYLSLKLRCIDQGQPTMSLRSHPESMRQRRGLAASPTLEVRQWDQSTAAKALMFNLDRFAALWVVLQKEAGIG
jgi:hypothetical protein